MAAQPLPPIAIRRIAIVVFLGLFALIGWQVGARTGLNAYVRAEAIDAVGRAGFSVKRVEVVGANRIDRLHVYDIALNQQDRSMAAFSLSEVRSELLRYGWVADARVSRRLPDTLVIDLVERSPVAVWQNRGGYTLIDGNGRLLPGVDAASMPGLPILVGQHAPSQMSKLELLLGSAPALRPRLAGASWVGNRRWDLHFKTGETLALPDDAERAEAALIEFARMDGVNRLLGRGVQRFDMRIADRFVLRPGRAGSLDGLEGFVGDHRRVETERPSAAAPSAAAPSAAAPSAAAPSAAAPSAAPGG
ncbi:MAG: cell division protein FtsQ/DivIB [Sphingopyxis sp.]